MINIDNLFVIINSMASVIIGIIGYFCWDKLKKHKLGVVLSVKQLKNKLRYFYFPIYFRLTRLNYSKHQFNYMKKIFDDNEMIKIEEELIIKIHNEILEIISDNQYLIDNDDNFNEYLLKYINHASLYINLRKFNITKKPSDYGFGFPNEFYDYIKNKTEQLNNEYNDILCYQKNVPLCNNTNDFIINIMNDPNSTFNKNLNDDKKNVSLYKNSNSVILDFDELNINDIPNLNKIFRRNDTLTKSNFSIN